MEDQNQPTGAVVATGSTINPTQQPPPDQTSQAVTQPASPGLPEGFTVDSTPQAAAQAATQGLPEGFTVDSTPQAAPKTEPAQPPTGLQRAVSTLKGQDDPQGSWYPELGDTAAGAVKSASNGLGGIADWINNPRGQLLSEPDPDSVKAAITSYRQAHPQATAEQAAAFVEQGINNGREPVSKQLKDASDWLHSAGQPTGFWENVGSIGEQALEWFGLDGMTKLASAPAKTAEAAKAVKGLLGTVDTVQHAAQAQQVAKVLSTNPKLAGLVAIGLKASKDAVLAGTQTYLHTGDSGEADKAGALTGVLGATLGGVGAAADKYKVVEKAANVINKIGDTAKGALSEQGVFSGLGNIIKSSRNTIDNIFHGAELNAEASKGVESAKKSTAEGAAKDTLDQGKVDVEAGTAVSKQATENKKTEQIDSADKALTAAKQAVHGNLVSGLKDASSNAVAPEDIADLLNEGLHGYKKQASADYQEGLTGKNGLETKLGNLPPSEHIGSNRAKAAKTALQTPDPAEHTDTSDLNTLAGEGMSAGTRKFLEERASGIKVTKGSGPVGKTDIAPPEVHTPIPASTIHDLVENAEAARNAESSKMWGSVDQLALHKYREGILADIDDMVAKSDNPEAVAKYKELRNTYRERVADLTSPTAKRINLNKPDKALGNAAEWLTAGGNSPGKIATVGRIIGPEAMGVVAETRVQGMRQLAETNPDKFVKDWHSTPQHLKDGFFGPDLTEKIDNAVGAYTDGNEYAAKQAQDAIENANTAHSDAMVSHDIDSNLAQTRLDTEHIAANTRISDNYDAAVKEISNKLDDARLVRDQAHVPYDNAFMKGLADGRVNDALTSGQVDLQDVLNVKNVAGAHWADIQKGLFERGMVSGYSPKGEPIPRTPEEVLDWWDSMKPDVRSEIFSSHDPNALTKYNGAIDTIRDAASTKRLIRNGMLVAAHAGTAIPGIAIGAAGHGALPTGLSELIGAVATGVAGATGKRLISSIVDRVADNPNTWKTLGRIGKAVERVGAGARAGAERAGLLTKPITARGTHDSKRAAFSSAATSLGGK